MSLITPTGRKPTGPRKGGPGKRADLARLYPTPLPLVFAPPSLASNILHLLTGLSPAPNLHTPKAKGTLDRATKSVWVKDRKDALRLWRAGFFGKGDLSRSEPTWLERTQGSGRTAEQVTAQRRAERKQFKLDRAAALASVQEQAEAAFAQGLEFDLAAAKAAVPSAATWRPSTAPASDPPPPTIVTGRDVDEPAVEEDRQEEPQEDLEHLQLTLQEAFFLSWGLDVLAIIDPSTDAQMTLQEIWASFQLCHVPALILKEDDRRPDNPFLVFYAVYHHYRSLGWVVKSGLKFCTDYLLYKRGPVFHHAEFAVVVVPVYEDPEDEASSPFELQNTRPFEWSWLSTLNRVNSQVHKTLVLSYVTIPALSRISTDELSSPACLQEYSVKEVTVRRFIPARMRD